MNPRHPAPRDGSEDPKGQGASAPTELAAFSATAVPVVTTAASRDDELAPPSDESARPDLAPAAQRLRTTLLGKYRIEQLLGEGGCGRVYLATHLQLRAQVAIKFLLSHWASRPVFRERFRREARALAILSHPGIVGIHDFGEDGGDMYLVMEYVRGEPLSKLVLQDGQPMPPAQAVELIDQLLEVLDVAHERGIIHREKLRGLVSAGEPELPKRRGRNGGTSQRSDCTVSARRSSRFLALWALFQFRTTPPSGVRSAR